MNLQGDKIGHWVKTVAEKADKFIIVSPFFSVNTEIRSWLAGIPDLQILIGDEFSVNNPDTLQKLSENSSTDLRCIYNAPDGKRLHAKVFFATEASGRCQALVGSANFTVSGLTKNKEQAVSFDSNNETDQPILEQIRKWIGNLKDSALCVDWEQARMENQKFRNQIIRIDNFGADLQVKNYWVLKTTAGTHGECFWKRFVEEKVVSVGWEDMIVDMSKKGYKPSEYSKGTLETSYNCCYDPKNEVSSRIAKRAASTIYSFSKEFSIHDRVIICKGYNYKNADVRLHGLAIVTDCAYDHSDSNWWRLKRSADIRCINLDIPNEVFANTLNRKSLIGTIFNISKEQYENFFSQISEF